MKTSTSVIQVASVCSRSYKTEDWPVGARSVTERAEGGEFGDSASDPALSGSGKTNSISWCYTADDAHSLIAGPSPPATGYVIPKESAPDGRTVAQHIADMLVEESLPKLPQRPAQLSLTCGTGFATAYTGGVA